MAKQIGDILDIYCPGCRLNLDGSVAALTDGEVAKVTCRTCYNESKFRPPVDMKAKKQKALERLMRQREKKMKGLDEADLPPPAPLRQLWDDLTDKVDSRYAKVYEPTRTYAAEAAILHKQLGMGIVHGVDADGEMNVLFRTGFHPLPSGQERDLDD